MTQATIEIDNIPEGYKVVAIRVPVDGEKMLMGDGTIGAASGEWTKPMVIVRKVPIMQVGKWYVDAKERAVNIVAVEDGAYPYRTDYGHRFNGHGETEYSVDFDLQREISEFEALVLIAKATGLEHIIVSTVGLGQQYELTIDHERLDSSSTTKMKGRLELIGPNEMRFKAYGPVSYDVCYTQGMQAFTTAKPSPNRQVELGKNYTIVVSTGTSRIELSGALRKVDGDKLQFDATTHGFKTFSID